MLGGNFMFLNLFLTIMLVLTFLYLRFTPYITARFDPTSGRSAPHRAYGQYSKQITDLSKVSLT